MILGRFNTDEKTLIIAEIGNNHEGDISLAKEMIAAAKESGADAVKFQTLVPEEFVNVKDTERMERLKKFALKFEEFERLKSYCDSLDITFFSTPLDLKSAAFLEQLTPFYKISSSDNTFFPLIRVIAETCKPVILSTGLAGMEDIASTISFLGKIWTEKGIMLKDNLAILHCVTAYPAETHELNLKSITGLKHFGLTVGYSDHSLGIDAAVIAAALGAQIIEKHFTLDKYYSSFRDHQISADPQEFKELVNSIRNVETMLGSQVKTIQESEKKIVSQLRRSMVALRNIGKDEILYRDMVAWVRPGGGIDPNNDSFFGKKLNKEIKAFSNLSPDDFDE